MPPVVLLMNSPAITKAPVRKVKNKVENKLLHLDYRNSFATRLCATKYATVQMQNTNRRALVTLRAISEVLDAQVSMRVTDSLTLLVVSESQKSCNQLTAEFQYKSQTLTMHYLQLYIVETRLLTRNNLNACNFNIHSVMMSDTSKLNVL